MNNRAVVFDDEFMRMILEFYGEHVYVHLRVKRWGASVLRLMRSRWSSVRGMLGSVGYSTVRAFYLESNLSMAKFAGLFGFRELRRKDGFVLLEACDA